MIRKLSRRILRKMDYLSDQKGIMNRYLREHENWKPHLDYTKQYICEFIERNSFKTVTIFGSGWLLDVPLEFLMNHAYHVVFYDISHPRQIRHKLSKFRNFEFIETDITGGLINTVFSAYREYWTRGKRIELKNMELTGFTPRIETDCYISLNILNQLDILIVDFLKKMNFFTEGELNRMRSEIQKNHLDSLPENKSCLITDFEELVKDKDQKIIENKNLVFTNLPIGKNTQQWEWLFDTSGTYNIGFTTTFNVIAMEL